MTSELDYIDTSIIYGAGSAIRKSFNFHDIVKASRLDEHLNQLIGAIDDLIAGQFEINDQIEGMKVKKAAKKELGRKGFRRLYSLIDIKDDLEVTLGINLRNVAGKRVLTFNDNKNPDEVTVIKSLNQVKKIEPFWGRSQNPVYHEMHIIVDSIISGIRNYDPLKNAITA